MVLVQQLLILGRFYNNVEQSQQILGAETSQPTSNTLRGERV